MPLITAGSRKTMGILRERDWPETFPSPKSFKMDSHGDVFMWSASPVVDEEYAEVLPGNATTPKSSPINCTHQDQCACEELSPAASLTSNSSDESLCSRIDRFIKEN